MKCREIVGKEVIDAGAKVIGTIRDLDIDTNKWSIGAIIVSTGFLRTTIIQAGNIDKVGDKVVLKVTADKIQKG